MLLNISNTLAGCVYFGPPTKWCVWRDCCGRLTYISLPFFWEHHQYHDINISCHEVSGGAQFYGFQQNAHVFWSYEISAAKFSQWADRLLMHLNYHSLFSIYIYLSWSRSQMCFLTIPLQKTNQKKKKKVLKSRTTSLRFCVWLNFGVVSLKHS